MSLTEKGNFCGFETDFMSGLLHDIIPVPFLLDINFEIYIFLSHLYSKFRVKPILVTIENILCYYMYMLISFNKKQKIIIIFYTVFPHTRFGQG